MPSSLTLQAYDDWKSSCELLVDSLSRYQPYDQNKKYTPRELEFYDSLSFRYAKAIETAFYFFRSWELELKGSASEFLRDQLLKMEKYGIVSCLCPRNYRSIHPRPKTSSIERLKDRRKTRQRINKI
jgi:hypothetical protein